MIKKTALFMILVCFVISIYLIPRAGQTAEQTGTNEQKVDAIFDQYNKADSPGVALAVIHDGGIIYTRGYGMADLEHDVPITPDTVFYIGSTSKQFVAMCILLLEEEGRLSLDDDIRKYLPEFPFYDKTITIRNLIYHTSGIRDFATLWRIAGKDVLDFMPEEEVYDMLCRQKELNFTPGTQQMYSNSGYFLLAMIVKNASGKSLREYADENIFRPLDMPSTHFHDDVSHLIKNRAFGYYQKSDGTFGNLFMRFSLVGSGGLYTSVKDLFKWDQNFYNNQLGKKRPELIAKMHQNGKLDNGTELNYAFALKNGTYRGLKTVSHSGGLGGYRAELMRFSDQQFSVILLSNLNSVMMAAQKVADIYLEEQVEKQTSGPTAKTVQRKEISIDPSLLDKYVGKYQIQPGNNLDITKEGNQLMVQATGQLKYPIFPESTAKFFLKVDDFQVTFVPEQDRIIIHRRGVYIPAIRIENVTYTSEQLNQYTGDYYSDELLVNYRIFLENGLLYLKFGYRPKMEMQKIRRDVFLPGYSLHFIRNNQDEITGFEMDAGRVQHLKFSKQNESNGVSP